MTTIEFFEHLFGNVEGGYMVYGKRSDSFVSHPMGEWEHVKEYIGLPDRYFRCCPVYEQPQPGRRGVAQDSLYLVFLWLDLDCEKKDSKKRYFKNKEDAIAWVKATMPWSIIVDSGNGLHVYLLLEVPFEIRTPEAFAKASYYSRKFLAWAQQQCPFDIDPANDLARVLRIPGSTHGDATVEVLEVGTGVVDTHWVSSLPVDEDRIMPSAVHEGATFNFTLDYNAAVPADMLMVLSAGNPDFAATWGGSRKPNDPSASGYRMSMISFAINAGWSVQDAVNLAIHYLRDKMHVTKEGMKLDRPDVWNHELAKAKVGELHINQIREQLEEAPANDKLAMVSTLMDIPPGSLLGVERLVPQGVGDVVQKNVMRLVMNDIFGNVVRVTLADALNRAASCSEIFNVAGHPFATYYGGKAAVPNQKWREAVFILWAMSDVQVIENNSYDAFLYSLKRYVQDSEPVHDPEAMKETGSIMFDEDIVVIPTAQFYSRIKLEYPDLRNNREIHDCVQRMEKEVGARVKFSSYKKTVINCLRVPRSFVGV